jgi:uncharacterized membrane protein SpoIIM required for sporulation
VISTRWLEKRRPHWTRLEQLTAASNRQGVAALASGELQELALLYRQTASDLAAVRENPGETQIATYLNQLLGRAHNLIYMGRRAKPGGIWEFYKHTYPAIFRAAFPDIVAAFIIFLAAGLTGFLLGMGDASFPRYLLGNGMMDTIEHHQMWTQSIVTVKPLASSAILTNNLVVSFTTFALGITAGLGTVWMLLLNGLMMGVVAVACWDAGMSMSLWSFVAPHGVLELPSIFIASGAGLGLGRAMLFPGEIPRSEAIAAAGARSVRLVLGIVPLLVIAGLIEGFISPSNLPAALKFSLAAALFTLLTLYLSTKSGEPVTPIK